MKRIAILVIAATNQPVYEFYIRNYWTELIEYLKEVKPHIDVYLLFEKKFDISDFPRLRDQIIQDQSSNLEALCDRRFHSPNIPGVLAKTILALELLKDRYDVFFRTNLSSIIKPSRFDDYIQRREDIIYSGAFVWKDKLREDMVLTNKIGPDKSVASLDELAKYKGNTFVSGSGYFLSQKEARYLVAEKSALRYDIPDDVSVGLMFTEHEVLRGFTRIIRPEIPNVEKLEMLNDKDACQFRLQHLPMGIAQQFWDAARHAGSWK